VAGAEPPAQCWPGWQGAHSGALVVVPGLVSTVPAGQSLTERQADWFSPEVKVSGGQGAHQRSVLGEGVLAT